MAQRTHTAGVHRRLRPHHLIITLGARVGLVYCRRLLVLDCDFAWTSMIYETLVLYIGHTRQSPTLKARLTLHAA